MITEKNVGEVWFVPGIGNIELIDGEAAGAGPGLSHGFIHFRPLDGTHTRHMRFCGVQWLVDHGRLVQSRA